MTKSVLCTMEALAGMTRPYVATMKPSGAMTMERTAKRMYVGVLVASSLLRVILSLQASSLTLVCLLLRFCRTGLIPLVIKGYLLIR